EGTTSEAIDFRGVQAAIAAAERALPHNTLFASEDVELPLSRPGAAEEDGGGEGPGRGRWESLDDAIMGGQSSSSWAEGVGQGVLEREAGGAYGRWRGVLVEEGGGFCGTVIKDMGFDTTGYDGVRLRVRGDGNRYKFNLRPSPAGELAPEMRYQAAFDTAAGEWTKVLCWSRE
ncbi:unnamed protein product, partial [Discosporangium mesarthrocarpum]